MKHISRQEVIGWFIDQNQDSKNGADIEKTLMFQSIYDIIIYNTDDGFDQPRDELGQFASKSGSKSKSLSQLSAVMNQESVKLEMPDGLTGAESDAEIYSALDPSTVKKFNDTIVGKKAPNGVNINDINPHAFAQATRRGVSLSDFEGIFDDPGAEIYPVKVLNNGQRTQKIYGTRAGIFIDIDSGEITSIFNKE